MQLIRFLLAVLVLNACSGCSWTYRFVIKNATKETIQVRYKLTSLERMGIFKRAVFIIDKEKKISEAEVHSSNDSMIVSIKLYPNTKAIIGSGRNTTYERYKHYIKPSEDFASIDFFNLDYLEIKTSQGTIKTTGRMIERLITKNKLTETRITIK